MKKFFLAFMAVATIAMVGCKKNGNDPVTPDPKPGPDPDPKPEVEIPEVDEPEDGYVTLVINIPANSDCNGIAFKGTMDNVTWTGADEYLSLEGPADPEHCIIFQPIENYKNWYKATYKLGEEAWGEGTLLAGKICLIYTGDSSWEGQAVNPSINDEYSTADATYNGDMLIYGSGLVYVTIGGWQKSECLTPEEYTITVVVPEFCDEPFDIELVGSFEGWGAEPVALEAVEGEENTYTATILANANAEWKVRGQGGWDKEIQYFDAEEEDPTKQWKGVPNNVLGDEHEVLIDYSNTEEDSYRWNVCAE